MRRAQRLAVAAWLGAFGLACGDSSAPIVATSMAVTAGDGQSAPTGTALPIPLRVVVTGSDSRPFVGATVTWAVTGGTGSLSPMSSTTDAQGSATTSLTLSNQVGPVTVRASVTGVTPVVFTATAFDPCAILTPLSLGATVNGALATTDCRVTDLSGAFYYTDQHVLDLAAQQNLTVTMMSVTTMSDSFDTYMEFYREAMAINNIVGFNDDLDPPPPPHEQDSRIEAIVAPGSYVLAASSWEPSTTGPYTLSAVTRTHALAGCAFVFVTRGIAVTDSVTRSDCVADTTTAGDTLFADAVVLFAEGGSVLTVAERSMDFNALLTLFAVDDTGGLVVAASNDDSIAGNPNAYLVATLPQTAAIGVFVLFIGTAGANETGAYTLEIKSSTTAGAGVAARERLPFGFRRAWPGGKGAALPLPPRRGSR